MLTKGNPSGALVAFGAALEYPGVPWSTRPPGRRPWGRPGGGSCATAEGISIDSAMCWHAEQRLPYHLYLIIKKGSRFYIRSK